MSFRQRGATLIELVMTIVILGIAIAGVVGAFALISGRSADALDQTRAVSLAQLYMDEILTKKFDDATPQGGVPKYTGACNVGPESGETRSTFDDVDDYDGLSNSPPATAQSVLTGYNGFSVSVAVSCAGSETGVGLANADAKRIDVTVIAPGSQDFIFSAYRANF